MKLTIPDRSPGASFSRLPSSFRLRRLGLERCLACEADLEHRAKATANKLSSIPAKRGNGVLEYWSTGILRCGELHPLCRIENAQMVRSGDAPGRFPRLTLGLVRELVRAL